MQHSKTYRKLSRQRHHYRALMRNLAFSLFQHERIKTTMPKAKEARRFAEKIITLGKKGSLHDRRRAMALMGNKIIHHGDSKKEDVIGKVFGELAERYKNRAGGYTRIIRLPRERAGDAASMVLFELVDAPEDKLFKVPGDEADSKEKPKKAEKKSVEGSESDQTEKEAKSA
ncbi:MAG: 50S ribosomal protein L17 [Bradymonadales bacterium]|nr:MAG: 50S ribosomal protein L17 [Bradymonadales bacterium]